VRTTVVLRIIEDRRDGLRGTVELSGAALRTFHSDEDLMDTIYEWSEPMTSSGKGSGSTSSSPMRATQLP